MQVKYMQRALELARQAALEDEVPIGAVIVDPEEDKIIAEAYNQSEHILDATAHAELAAIQKACRKLGQNRLRGMDLYVTLEPCTMCAGAISFARINNLYFGAYDAKGGAVASGVRFYDARPAITSRLFRAGFWKKNAGRYLKIFQK